MEGLEGVKILSQNTSNYNDIGIWFIMIFLIGAFIILASELIYEIYEWDNYISLFLVIPMMIILFAIYFIWNDKSKTEITEIKVTPIEDKYYIDLNKYNVISKDGEIITIHLKEVDND